MNPARPDFAGVVLSLGSEPGLVAAHPIVPSAVAASRASPRQPGWGRAAARLAAAGLKVRAINFEERLQPGAMCNALVASCAALGAWPFVFASAVYAAGALAANSSRYDGEAARSGLRTSQNADG